MEKLLIKSATIAFVGHQNYQQEMDVLLEDGVITKIDKKIDQDDNTNLLDGAGQYLAPGFFDLNVNFGEPGFETKETIASGAAAAAAGGFTGVALQPNTYPPIHSQSEVSFLINRSKDNLVDVHPLGAVSRDRAGKDLAELYDMKCNGAVAFTDGNKAVVQAGLMGRALLYAKGFGGLIIAYADDRSISGDAKVNEGEMSTFLGMKGKPNLAEELMLSRDIYLADYHDAPIHFTTISTAGSVALIRHAKKRGLKVTCDVAVHHLTLTDDALIGFDSNYKVQPPLRTSADVEALIEGLKDGTIDAIVSQHTPHEIEFKNVEFEIAKNGIIGLQTTLSLLIGLQLPIDLIVEKLAVNPRKILKLAVPALQEGKIANLVLFDPKQEWLFDKKTNASKSANSPYFNMNLTGKVNFAVNNGVFRHYK